MKAMSASQSIDGWACFARQHATTCKLLSWAKRICLGKYKARSKPGVNLVCPPAPNHWPKNQSLSYTIISNITLPPSPDEDKHTWHYSLRRLCISSTNYVIFGILVYHGGVLLLLCWRIKCMMFFYVFIICVFIFICHQPTRDCRSNLACMDKCGTFTWLHSRCVHVN